MNVPRIKYRSMAVLLIAALALAFIGPAAARGLTAQAAGAQASAAPAMAGMDMGASADVASRKLSRLDFNNAMRKLWEEHVTWTRLYIVSVAGDLPDQDLTAQRLLQNQVDIGNAIKPFYGDKAGNKLTALLNDHILLAAEVLKDAKTGDPGLQDALARWYANANDIAAFLSAANPKSWPLDQMQAMMKSHLDLTLKEATARLQGNYAADIQDYDAVENEILQMADMLTNGIIAQFLRKFN